ncbi:hypothetical protein [Novosphingobium gossypii]|uniref:hypothetical protein n=1 Tax=Novosphingobium gossypii TaxID=1604774 RepID=UPI003D2380C9
MTTSGALAIAIGLIVLAVVIGIAVTAMRRRHSAQLRDRYGEEYHRAVDAAGGVHRGETVLHDREQRVAEFHIHPLTLAQRETFIVAWRQVQARFVDDPAGAVTQADVLLTDVMTARGYPTVDLEQRYEDLSVDHAEVVAHYRTGHAIAQNHAQGGAETEELRRAMIHYRALFDDLVNEPEASDVVIEHRGGRVIDLRRETTRRG